MLEITHSPSVQRPLPAPTPPPITAAQTSPMPRRLPRTHKQSNLLTPVRIIPKVQFQPIPGGVRNLNVICQEAINFLTECIWAKSLNIFTPKKLMPASTPTCLDHEQVVMPMVHPITGKTISSYKWLMKDPTTAEMWQMAFGKDVGDMAQGDQKTEQKGTNSIFVMTHDKISRIPKGQTVTYVRVVIDFCPQKEDPHCIQITAGGNLIKYPGELLTRTADLTTSKLMWNSVLSTKDAKYMCLDIKNIYLSAPLDRYEYMKIPLALFPE